MTKQRGRKSASSMTVVPLAGMNPPGPPGGLNETEAALWHSIVNTKPADWFQGTEQLLIAYCHHSHTAHVLDRVLNDFEIEWLKTDEGLERYRKLLSMRELQTRTIISLSRVMRLTQQSRYTPQRAATLSDGTTPGKKIWET